jgi:hypothetical protein
MFRLLPVPVPAPVNERSLQTVNAELYSTPVIEPKLMEVAMKLKKVFTNIECEVDKFLYEFKSYNPELKKVYLEYLNFGRLQEEAEGAPRRGGSENEDEINNRVSSLLYKELVNTKTETKTETMTKVEAKAVRG